MQTLHPSLIILIAREPGHAPLVIEARPRHVAPIAVHVVEQAFFGIIRPEAIADIEHADIVIEQILTRPHDPEPAIDPVAAEILVLLHRRIFVPLREARRAREDVSPRLVPLVQLEGLGVVFADVQLQVLAHACGRVVEDAVEGLREDSVDVEEHDPVEVVPAGDPQLCHYF